jgi:YVTN family beta-propeller protein
MVIVCVTAVAGCGTARPMTARPMAPTTSPSSSPSNSPLPWPDLLAGMPVPPSAENVYAAVSPNNFSPAVVGARNLVYVPNNGSNDVYVIDPATFQVIDKFAGGNEPQHVVPSYDMRTLYVAADMVPGGSITPIDPMTGKPGRALPIPDVYNLYFTPDGRYAVVVAEEYKRLDFYDPRTWELRTSVAFPACAGINHMDFTADGRYALIACEFANRMQVLDVAGQQPVRDFELTQVPNGMPQDTRLAPDGKTFYVADMMANGVYLFDGAATRQLGFIPTGKGAHGIYFSRDGRRMFVTNRGEGSVSVLDPATGTPITKWQIPGGGSPDMGALSADGTQLWLSGRYDNVVYVLSTDDGHLLAKIPVGNGPHGLAYWPQPGRYSLGHTANIR